GPTADLGPEVGEGARAYGLPDARHEPRGEGQVGLRRQRDPEHLPGPEEVAEVGPAEPRAGGSGAALLDRPVLAEPFDLGQVQPEAAKAEMEGVPVPGDPGRHRAVEGVDPAQGALDQVVRLADAQEVTRPP